MSKRIKRCFVSFCRKKFKNRKSLRAHLVSEHFIIPDLEWNRKVKPEKEGKPLRRVRMMKHAAECKKYRDKISKLQIAKGKRHV